MREGLVTVYSFFLSFSRFEFLLGGDGGFVAHAGGLIHGTLASICLSLVDLLGLVTFLFFLYALYFDFCEQCIRKTALIPLVHRFCRFCISCDYFTAYKRLVNGIEALEGVDVPRIFLDFVLLGQ